LKIFSEKKEEQSGFLAKGRANDLGTKALKWKGGVSGFVVGDLGLTVF